MVTHDLHLVKTFNHRVITIKNGVIESDYPDASHIEAEPYTFESPEDEIGSYFLNEDTSDFEYLMETYGIDPSKDTIETDAQASVEEEVNAQ
jgi:ABC-type methionine transport system ATPase subunit